VNWQPGEGVHIFVNDNVGQTWSRSVDVAADEAGAITDSFYLPDWFVATYAVTATGEVSGTATTTFTDGNVRVGLSGVASATISWSKYSNTTCSGAAGSSGSVAAGSGFTTAAAAGATESVKLTAPASVSGKSFGSWTSGADTRATLTICVVGTPGTQNWSANYVESTPPTVTVTTTPSAPPAGQGGYFNAADVAANGGSITVNVSATDASGVTNLSCADNGSPVTVDGQSGSSPRTGSLGLSADGTHNVVCTATDGASPANTGNTGSSNTATVRIDKTSPLITDEGPTPAVPDGSNGWYVTPVANGFAASDGGSGLSVACAASFPKSVSTGAAEGSAVTVGSGSCADVAGNVNAGTSSAAFKIDATAPSGVVGAPARAPDHNGWFNGPVDVVFAGSDATSGIDSCSLVGYAGPDGVGLSVEGSCSDLAGNSSGPVASGLFDYDATAPSGVVGAPARAPDHNGWFNGPVDVVFAGSDATSGIDSCSLVGYAGPDGVGLSVEGSCWDLAGNSSGPVASGLFDYDATAPTLNPSVSPNPALLNASATAAARATDATSGVDYEGCDPVVTSAVGYHTVGCTATDRAGNMGTAQAGYSVVYDWSGFFQPVENPGPGPTYVFNRVKAGSAIPMKFRLSGYQGLGLFMTGYPEDDRANLPGPDHRNSPGERWVDRGECS
jgi:hypothetical protein